jgi:predicted PhzF superfamily epimerase YddE/YHI9
VDAFTSRAFAGNPAVVCPLDPWLDDELLRSVASENNLSETAFFVPNDDSYELRWLTPRCEAKLCGHATLASAFVIMQIFTPTVDSVRSGTRFGGTVAVKRDGDLLRMDFPWLPPWNCENAPAESVEGLGKTPACVMQIEDNYFAVYDLEKDITQIQTDLHLLENLHPAGVAVTAAGNDCDFVSRYFAPSFGSPQDPVTGSTRCLLAPYWAQRWGKTNLHAKQLSERGGELGCEAKEKRVILKASAALTLRGELML